MDIKKTSIKEIGLSNRSVNALRRCGVTSVEEMLAFDRETLSEVRNLGAKSIDEIMEKISEYKKLSTGKLIEDFDSWINEKEGMDFVRAYLQSENACIEELEQLSARAFNLLKVNGYEYLYQIAFITEEQLMEIPKMDKLSTNDIVAVVNGYIYSIKAAVIEKANSTGGAAKQDINELIREPDLHEKILEYVKTNDLSVEELGLSNRPKNQLIKNGYTKLSEIIFMTEHDFSQMNAMGAGSVKDIMDKINGYLEENESRMLAVCSGDEDALWSDGEIKRRILSRYEELGFRGESSSDFAAGMELPEIINHERVAKALDDLVEEGYLEVRNNKYYRVYESFADYLGTCDAISDRSKEFIDRRLQGETLESIAQEHGLTRERVRQVVKRDVVKVQAHYSAEKRTSLFTEDRYKYFYENYAFEENDGEKWLGITISNRMYFELNDIVQGDKSLDEALNDNSLEKSLRVKIKDYINRNKLFVDGVWIERKRSALELHVLKQFCREEVSFDKFVDIYNSFLKENGIEFNEELYYVDRVLATRKNRFAESRYVLWKMYEMLRYYDIDGRDYTELLDTLNLEAYENIEFSTYKLLKDYPELMKKYDIRDKYELHNLLRKIVPEGSYNDFSCGRMPDIKFGTFDRDAAILEIMMNNSPISSDDLIDLIHREYGYDKDTILGTYLRHLNMYYHQGEYRADHKEMSDGNMQALKQVLQDDFYYIDDIRRIYSRTVQGADSEEINSYNLKKMGFIVLSKYVVQNHDSLEAYCEHILTCDDVVDITPYRKKLTYVQMFSAKLSELKRNLDIIEFDPNQIINIRKLEAAGITKEILRQYCDQVYDFVQDNTYFSIQSLRKDGFGSELYDLGFSDWFYANVLISDERFSFGNIYSNIILYKGNLDITIQSFEIDRIKASGVIDVFDLMNELTDDYGCVITDKADIPYKVQNTEVYYDKYMDRLYANVELFYRELDE